MNPLRSALPRLVLLCLVPMCLPAAMRADGRPTVPGEVLVGLRAAQDTPQAVADIAASTGQVAGRQAALHVVRLRLRKGLSVESAIAQLGQRSDVLYAEPNGIYSTTGAPSDPYWGNQWAPCRIQADKAWSIWQPSAQVVLAVVDTGIDYTHPDLTNKITRDSSGNVIGYNAVGLNAVSGIGTDPLDDHGHGTHVAGIAGAQVDNCVGVAGIAGWNGVAGATDTSTRLMPVKVLDSTGSGTDASVSDGITWATDHGAQIINMSLGGGGSTTLQNAVNYALSKGVVVVAAAGNSSSSVPIYPGGYPGVISVAATDQNDVLTSFSNYGSWVSTAAPGYLIYSTLPTYPAGANFGTNYGYLSGTSMATPHVSGEAALLLGQFPSLTSSQVTNLIVTSVDPYGPYNGETLATGAGRIDALTALQNAGAGGGGGTPTVPGAPLGLQATAGNGQVTLSWGFSSGAASYNVYRSTAPGAEGPTPYKTGVPCTTFTDTGLTNGVTYFYQVTAVNSVGESTKSNEACATPTPGAPAAPTGLAATAGNAQVGLAWNASSGATYYTVWRGTSSGTETLLADNITSTAYTDTAVTNGTTYYYMVTASNSYGRSPASNEASATPQTTSSGGSVLAPTNLAASANKKGIALGWTQSASSGVVKNCIYRSTSLNGGYSAVATIKAGTSYTDTGASKGVTYYYCVTAINSAGTESSPSNTASARR